MNFYGKYCLLLFLLLILLNMYKNISSKNMVKTREYDELSCHNTNTDWNNINSWRLKDVPSSKNIISLKNKKAYYSLLKDIDEILTDNNIKYVLVAGTLLGSYRHGDIIPWDDDADICIRYEDNNRLFQLQDKFKKKRIVLNKGCLACWSNYYKDICNYLNDRSLIDKNYSKTSMKKCKSTKYFATFSRGNIHVDIFHIIPIYDKYNKKMYTVLGNNRLINDVQVDAMFNIVKCPFGPLSLNCPSNTKELLCHQYNNNLQFPTLDGIKNKSLIPGMWSGADSNIPHIVKNKDGDYMFKNVALIKF